MSKIRNLEKQSGIIRLLLFLHERGEYMLSKIWADGGISVHQGYKALEKCKELELVKSRIDNTSYPARNMISLTTKGKKVAELLKKIEEVLEG